MNIFLDAVPLNNDILYLNMDILDCSFLCKEMATDAVFGANHRCGEVQVLFCDESPLWGGAGAIFGTNHHCREVQVLFLGRITAVGRCRCYFWDESLLCRRQTIGQIGKSIIK